jgi:hypothetical protein
MTMHFHIAPVPSTVALVEQAPIEKVRTGYRAVVEITGYADGQMSLVTSRIEGSRGSRSIVQAGNLMFRDADETKDALDLLADRVSAVAASAE